MAHHPKIHHRRSVRLKGYDYSQNGLYFITICTYQREYLFGEVINGKMVLNDYGRIANECWLQIPEHFPHVVLHEHIVMPNHVHGIVELANNDGTVELVGAQNFVPLPIQRPSARHQFQKIIPRSVGSIVRGYKIGVTKWFRVNTDIYTVWQRNFYENIIRDEKTYQTISNYIFSNLKNGMRISFIKDRFLGG